MLYSLLLAGGRSARMGRDKSSLEHDGKTRLEHALSLLQDTGADHILLSGNVPGLDSLPDRIPDCGPLGGLHAALHHIDEQGALDKSLLLIIPIDMPRLDSATLLRLDQAIGSAASCRYDGEVFPCVFKASHALMTHLDNLLAESTTLGGKRSMKALLALGESRALPRDGLPDGVFDNLNTPEDWQAFLATRRDPRRE
jgi:molybdopterin-guanine dinucleotide biosynthesis protein A